MFSVLIPALVVSSFTQDSLLISQGGIRPWSQEHGVSGVILQAPEGRAITVPAISSDGAAIAFGSNPHGEWKLFVIDEESRTWNEMHGLDRSFFGKIAWSPTAKKVVFEVDGHTVGENHIHLLDGQTGEVQRLTEEDSVDLDPAWSPDGTRLALVAVVEQEVKTYADMIWVERVSELDVLDVETGERSRLTALNGSMTDPQWSPDGSQIAFVVDRALYVLTMATQEVRKMASDLTPGAPPRWSPDGEALLIAGRMASSPGPPDQPIDEANELSAQLLTIDVGNQQILAHDWPSDVWHYDWHQAGDVILATGNKRLYRKNLDGGDVEVVLEGLDFYSIVIRSPRLNLPRSERPDR